MILLNILQGLAANYLNIRQHKGAANKGLKKKKKQISKLTQGLPTS